ncbi:MULTISPECIES: hypothetical protein [unclassified Bradyrhizobium]|uniref:hypothetical protein n=1 Tax=unclassified Bradyrhizobium TaxID=2631580 RepID=UPI001FFBD554|nr:MULTISPECIES: hypothetical protein [unclassified Bradyrhizobium]MCK1710172.1 hypothetical protein [Bradyrhizobium sp. 143]MCK1726733.1 hypothetical protein [Bradyrhizobium sp. 142]
MNDLSIPAPSVGILELPAVEAIAEISTSSTLLSTGSRQQMLRSTRYPSAAPMLPAPRRAA